MTIKEEFEKWLSTYNQVDPITLITNMFEAYQAAHEAQQVRIDELEKVNSLWVSKSIEREKHLEIANNKVEELSEKLHIYLSGNLITLDTMLDNDKKIASLEARCQELEDALQFYAQLDWKVNTDFWQSRAKQALSTKSPTESLDRFENDCYEKCAMIANQWADARVEPINHSLNNCAEAIRKLKKEVG